MSRSVRGAVMCFALLSSGCTTLGGGQVDAFSRDDAAIMVAGGQKLYTRDQIIGYYVELDTADQQTAFRNRVTDHYMGLIDEQYHKYANKLFSDGIEIALGFDTAIIGLAATAALFEDAADDLATVTSAFAGTRGAIDKNLYFDRTLPALITTMDAERTIIETELIASKQRSVNEYSIEAAIRDVRRYQQAGTLMRAVNRVSGDAGAKLADAEAQQIPVVKYNCEPNRQLQPRLLSLQGLIGKAVNKAKQGSDAADKRQGREAMAKLARPFGIPVPAGFELGGTQPQVDAMSLAMAQAMLGSSSERNFCTAADIDKLEKDLAAIGVS